MNTQEAIEVAIQGGKIRYIKSGTVYRVLGKGKGKMEDGTWFEGVAYQGVGEDKMIYTRPYAMFSGFDVVR